MIVIITDKKGWMGHSEGAVLGVTSEKGKDLIKRKVARDKDKPVARKTVKKKQQTVSKKNKMVRAAKTK
jgi:hypothetical protein